MVNYMDKRSNRIIRLTCVLNLLAVNRVAIIGVAKKRVRFLKQKEAERLSQYFGPTSTYEKHPLRRVLTPIQYLCRN